MDLLRNIEVDQAIMEGEDVRYSRRRTQGDVARSKGDRYSPAKGFLYGYAALEETMKLQPDLSLWGMVVFVAGSLGGMGEVAQAEVGDPIGLVTGVVGIDVELRRPGQPAQFVQLGLPLQEGDELLVPADQSAMVFIPAASMVLQIRGQSLVEFRATTERLNIRLAAGVMRTTCGDTAAASGTFLFTPLGRCEVAAGTLVVEHKAAEQVGTSQSRFAFRSDSPGLAVGVHALHLETSLELPAGMQVVLAPGGQAPQAIPLAPSGTGSARWAEELPLAAARVHRLRVVEDLRNDLVQRTALAAALRAPTGLGRRPPQNIIDQPPVQPRGPSQAIRLPPAVTPSRPRVTDTVVNELARQNVGNLLGLLPGRGPVAPVGPNSLIQGRR